MTHFQNPGAAFFIRLIAFILLFAFFTSPGFADSSIPESSKATFIDSGSR